jgi:hypothetical protein
MPEVTAANISASAWSARAVTASLARTIDPSGGNL